MTKSDNEKYTEEQIGKLNEQLDSEKKKDLESLKKREKISTKTVEDLMRDRSVAKQGSFAQVGQKEAGVSAGYIAKEDATKNTFILKQFYKTMDQPNITAQDKSNMADAARELIGSVFYSINLNDRAPKEQLVTPDKDNPNSLYIRSKFFSEVISLGEFSGGKDFHFQPEGERLKALEGFEKVIASCHMLGELDYHAGNIMVQKQKIQETDKGGTPLEDINGNPVYTTKEVAVKIDHGRSFMRFHQDFNSMIESTYTHCFKNFGYIEAIDNGNLNFDVKKYSDSLKQMTSQLDERQVEAIVDQKIADLKKAGFDPKGISIAYTFDNKNNLAVNIKDSDNLKEVFTKNIKQNLANMKEISKAVEIITKFDDKCLDKEFKKGKWLEEFAAPPPRDPIAYAVAKNITIEGKDPLEWKKEYDNKQLDEAKAQAVKESKQNKPEEIKWEKYDNWMPVKPVKDIEKLVDDFTSSPLKGKDEVHNLYINILNKFVDNKVLKGGEMGLFLTDDAFKDHLNKSTKLLATKLDGCSVGDKINYKVAEFCNNIGFKKISEHFLQGVSPEAKAKIQTLESQKVHEIIKGIGESLNNKGVTKIGQKLSADKSQSTDKSPSSRGR